MENINIASFDFDDSKIYQKLDDIGKQIEDLNVKREQEKRILQDLNKEYNSTSKEMEKLTKSGKGQSDEYTELANKQNELTRSIVKQKQEISDVTNQTRLLTNESKSLSKVLDAQEKIQSILADTYDVESRSISQLREDRKLLITLRNQEVAVMGKQSDAAKVYNDLIEKTTNQEKSLVAETEKRFYQIGDYAGQLQGSFQGVIDAIGQIGSGDVVGGIDGLKTSFGGLVTSVRAFVATPIGAIVTGLVALGAAVKYIWDYNAAIKENLILIEQMTDVTGSSADKIRQSIQSITETYGRDFKETLQEVKELANDFGLTYSDALDVYNKGLAQGGNLNKEFGDSIREYGVLFQQAGFSAEEFVAVINSGADLGIYTDKLPDAIKEAGLSLQEQTKATRDSLVNAFGASFADDILKRVKTGETTVKDALFEISQEAERANLNQQQLAQLTADVFRGAGEDAGGAVKIFEALNRSIDELNRPLTEVEQKQEDLRQSFEELEQAKDDAFKSESMQKFQANLEILWNKVLVKLFNFLGGAIQVTVDGITQINAGFLTFESYVNNVIRAVESISFRKPLESFNELKKAITDFNWEETYNANAGDSSARGQSMRAAREALQGIVDTATQGAASAKVREGLNRQTSNNLGNTPSTKTTSKKSKEVEQAKKDLETAKKLQEQYYKDLAQLAYDYGQNELANQIKLNADKIKNAQILSDEMLNIVRTQLDEELRLKQLSAQKELELNNQRAKEENEKAVEEINKLKISEAEKNNLRISANNVLNEQLSLNQQRFQEQSFENRQLFEQQVMQYEQELYENKQLIEQQRKDFEFQQNMLRLENQGIIEKDKQLMLLTQQYVEEMALLRDKKNAELITTQEFDDASEQLTIQKNQREAEINRIAKENELMQYSNMLGNLSALFNENTAAYKVTASAKALIDTYGAANKALNDETTPSFFLRAINAGIAVATGLSNVAKINKVKTDSRGGSSLSTPSTSAGTTTNTYQSQYAGGSLTGLDGISTISGYNQANTFGSINDPSSIADAVRQGAESGSRQGSQSGIRDLSTDRNILDTSGY